MKNKHRPKLKPTFADGKPCIITTDYEAVDRKVVWTWFIAGMRRSDKRCFAGEFIKLEIYIYTLFHDANSTSTAIRSNRLFSTCSSGSGSAGRLGSKRASIEEREARR